MTQHKQHGKHKPQTTHHGVQNRPLDMDYGHNGENVVVVFSRPVENIVLTTQQAMDMIGGIQVAIKGLEVHKAGNG